MDTEVDKFSETCMKVKDKDIKGPLMDEVIACK